MYEEIKMNETFKVSSGWAMDRERFSRDAVHLFNLAIDRSRVMIKLPSDTLNGIRFYNNNDILARLESRFTEKEFMSNVGPCIDKALIDAAQSDYWYTYEKDYGMDDADEVESIYEDENE
jgi:hypothetical protein